MAICYIVGAGDFYGSFYPEKEDLVIAADAGLNTLIELGIRCDILLGDMDSLAESGEQCASSRLRSSPLTEKAEIITFPVKKDETDTHLAYLEGVKRGYSIFMLYGCVGGREDHTFANYSLLLYGKNRGHSVTLIGRNSEIFVIKNETVALTGRVGATFSIFAVGGVANGVSILGAKYETADTTLTPEFPLGVSNSFLSGEVTVSVENGALLVIKYV